MMTVEYSVFLSLWEEEHFRLCVVNISSYVAQMTVSHWKENQYFDAAISVFTHSSSILQLLTS